jgi:hypothetical protein
VSHITLPRAVGELVQDLTDHAYNDGVQELERPSEQTTKALAALFAALKEPELKPEPATVEQVIEAYESSRYEGRLDDYSEGWREAERFHGIITKEDKP